MARGTNQATLPADPGGPHTEGASDYRHELELDRAMARVSYDTRGAKYRREILALAARLCSSTRGRAARILLSLPAKWRTDDD